MMSSLRVPEEARLSNGRAMVALDLETTSQAQFDGDGAAALTQLSLSAWPSSSVLGEGAGLAETACCTGGVFLLPWFPPSAQPWGWSRARARVTYQFWLSFYGFHTKILTLFRGATGHSTFPSRLRVVLALAALSGRECHPWLVTMCTRQAQRGGVKGTQFRTQFF